MQSLPFDPKKLPAELRRSLTSAIEIEDHGAAIDSMENYLHAGGRRTPTLLVALAFCEVEFARRIMVDEVMERSTRALELLDEAAALGADPADFAGLRSLAERFRAFGRKEEKRVRNLRDADPASLDLRQLTEVARQLEEQGDPPSRARAARLLLLGSQRAPAESTWEEPDAQRHDLYVRAGLAFADAGLWKEALPILVYTTETKPSQPGHDSWMSEFAYVRLLRYAAEKDDPERYLRLWEQARRWSERHGESYFPFPRPAQDEALRACLEFRLREPCEQLLAIFEQHRAPRTISPEVRQLLAAARSFVGANPRP
jgi:hypothetical protein